MVTLWKADWNCNQTFILYMFYTFFLWHFLQTPSTPLWPGPSLKTPRSIWKTHNLFWSVFELNNFKDAHNLANKRKAALKKMGLLPTKEEYIDEEELPPENDVEGPIIERIIGGCCSDPGDEAGCSSYVKGMYTTFFVCLFKSVLQ